MFGTGEIVVILAVILVLFGGKKLPELAKNLGKGIREFKDALRGGLSSSTEAPSDKKEEEKKS